MSKPTHEPSLEAFSHSASGDEMRQCAIGIAVAFALASRAAAQGTFAGTGLHAGQTVRVIDALTGERFKGAVESTTADLIRVDGRDFTPRSVRRIDRAGDPLWDGMIIGAIAGVGLSLTPTEACVQKSRGQCLASGIETGFLLGTAIDWMHTGYTTVYPQITTQRRIHLAPVWGRRLRAVAIGWTF